VSTCVDDYKTFLRSTNATPATNPADLNEAVFAVPALPPRLTGTTPNSDLSSNVANNTQGLKKTPTGPKSLFPEVHTQLLLDRITQLQASSITALVESIHLELREHKVKKNAIENKVREVGEKCKEKRVWVIKPALLVSLLVLHTSLVCSTANPLLKATAELCCIMYTFPMFHNL